MRRVALIHNPASGAASEHDLPSLLAAAGAEVEELPIERLDATAGTDAERLVVAGGDGSIAPVAALAAEHGVELAVIPVGTANDFAERMGLPAEVEAAAELAVSGRRTRSVDLARIGERPFVNVASLGLAPAAAEAAVELKPKLGALAYTVGALRAATAEQPLRCRIDCAGEQLFEGEAWQVTVGCTGAFGGGSQIDADADDGRLDVVVIEGGPRAALAQRAIGMRTGGIERQQGVHSRRCPTIAVTVDGERDLNVDGEVVGSMELGGPTLRCSVAAQAVRLVIG